MKKIIYFIIILVTLGCVNNNESINLIHETQPSHDLNLPNWGPYTKKYIGVSHIPDIEKGLRFDLSIFPGIAHQKTVIPNVMKKSSFHPWEASPNLEYFSFRHDLIWKDKLFADISYAKIDTHARIFTLEYQNNTSEKQHVTAQLVASMHFPPLKPHNPETRLQYATISLTDNALWVDAIDYAKLQYAIPGHRDELVYDGMLKGEIRDNHLINGSGIGKGFGRKSGDELTYTFTISESLPNANMVLRYKTREPKKASVEISINGTKNNINLKATDRLLLQTISLGDLSKGDHTITIKTITKTKLILDGFAVIGNNDTHNISIEPVIWQDAPEIIEGPLKNSLVLKYKNTDTYYGMYWQPKQFLIREWNGKDLPATLHENDTTQVTQFTGSGEGHFVNVFIKPFLVKPNSKTTVYGYVCEGTLEEVQEQLANASAIDYTKTNATGKKHLVTDRIIPAGKKYLFSQERMRANTICNVVYPVYTQRQYIRHHAPGRKWDCLYTWDAGFIGLGLSEVSIQRGEENLNAYLNEPTEQSAFIHHGTPLPVQFYQFHELWNKTQNDSLARENYPKLKRYYNFLLGKIATSSTRNLKSGLLRTWDYFYNSGGWDDYPAQKHVHDQKLTKTVTPVISTSHAIRAAKILQMTAHHLALEKDVEVFKKDISELSTALQEHAWDPTTGYYGYVQHNSFKQASEILKYKDTINFNMGLGGASPITAGITNKEQTKRILSHLKTEGRLWSSMGLSTVDQSAPYFTEKGYWNGSVWMPHQWFFWKSMLDLGEDEFAYKIATNALDIWKRETEKSYNCYEYFSIKEEIGKGWHQFSGLSTPVLSWFNAYYKVGTITTGNDVWITSKKWNTDFSEVSIDLRVFNHVDSPFSMVVCVNPNFKYKVLWKGHEITPKIFEKGILSITITDKESQGNLKIMPISSKQSI